MQSNKFLRYNLLFKNREYENAYFQTKVGHQKILLRIMMVFILMQAFLGLLLNPYNKPVFRIEYLMSLAFLIIIILGTLFLSNKKPLWVENLVYLFFTASMFIFLEMAINLNEQYLSRTTYFNAGIYLELFLLSLVVVKIYWIKSIIVFITTCALCCTRYLPIGYIDNNNYFHVLVLILNALILAATAYLFEKRDRANFFERLNKEYSLQCFKELIETVFPNPILVTQGDAILFQNEEAYKTFGCKEPSEWLSCFKRMTINDQELGTERNLSSEREEDYDFLLKYKDCLFSSKSKSDYNFYQFLGDNKKSSNERTSVSKNFRVLYLNERGKEFNYDVKIKNIVWEKNYALMTVISENKLVQKLKAVKEKDLLKDKILATVSHNLRTPLNGIIGMISESLSNLKDLSIKKSLEIAFRSSHHLLFMINCILDYHHITEGKLQLNNEVFSLWELIKDISKLFSYQAKLKKLKFEKTNNSSDPKAMITSDKNRLSQVLFNLLSNALKFTMSGSISIELNEVKEMSREFIKEDKYEPASSRYLIKVKDTGIGIEKNDLKRIFKLFGGVDGNDESEPKANGFGLGLAISQNLVKLLNNNSEEGEIQVTTELGCGSCFCFPLMDFNNNTRVKSSVLEISSSMKEPNSNEIYYKPTKDSKLRLNNEKHLEVVHSGEEAEKKS